MIINGSEWGSQKELQKAKYRDAILEIGPNWRSGQANDPGGDTLLVGIDTCSVDFLPTPGEFLNSLVFNRRTGTFGIEPQTFDTIKLSTAIAYMASCEIDPDTNDPYVKAITNRFPVSQECLDGLNQELDCAVSLSTILENKVEIIKDPKNWLLLYEISDTKSLICKVNKKNSKKTWRFVDWEIAAEYLSELKYILKKNGKISIEDFIGGGGLDTESRLYKLCAAAGLEVQEYVRDPKNTNSEIILRSMEEGDSYGTPFRAVLRRCDANDDGGGEDSDCDCPPTTEPEKELVYV